MFVEFMQFLVEATPIVVVFVIWAVLVVMFIALVGIVVKRIFDFLGDSPGARFALIALALIGFLAYHMGAFPMEWYAYLGMPKLLSISGF